MASSLTTAYVQLLPSTEGMGSTLANELNSAAGTAGTSASSSFGNKFTRGLATVGGIGAAALAATTTAVVSFGKSAVEAGQSFDTSMSQLAATMGMTGDQINATEEQLASMSEEEKAATLEVQSSFESLRDFAQQMGNTTAFSASEAADGLNVLAMAGYDAESQISTLPGVLSLASAGGLSIADAADYATGILAGFSSETLSASEVADSLAKISSSAKGDVQSFGEALSTVAGMATTTGQSFDDMTVALGILGNNNYSASEAGNALSRTLKNIYQPTDSAKSAMQELGVAAYTAEGEARPLQDVLKDLNSSIDGMSDEAKNATLSKIFDSATLKSVPALLNNATDSWDELAATMEESEGAASAMADVQLDNLSGDITLFQSALEGAKIAISDELTPSLREFVTFGTDSLSSLTTAFQEGGISGAMSELGDILSEGIGNITTMLPDIVSAGASLMQSLFEGMITNLPLLADAAIEIIVNLADGISSSLPNLIPTIVEVILQITSTLIDHLPDLINAGLSIFSGLVEGLTQAIPIIIEALPDLIDSIIDTLVEALPMLQEGATTMFLAIVDALPEIIEALADALPEVIDSIADFLTNGGLETIATSSLTMFLAIVTSLPQILGSLLSALGDLIVNLGVALVDYQARIGGYAAELFAGLVDGLTEAAPKVIDAIKSKIEEWKTAISSKISEFKTIGGNLITGLWNGISDKASWLYNQITGMGDTIVTKVKNLFGVASPSKVFAEIGGYLAEGLEVGWETEIGDVKDNITKDMDMEGNLSLKYADASSGIGHYSNILASSGTSNSDALNGSRITLPIDINLGDTKLKEIIYEYMLTKTGDKTTALRLAQGGAY